jgi:hypothetical protein
MQDQRQVQLRSDCPGDAKALCAVIQSAAAELGKSIETSMTDNYAGVIITKDRRRPIFNSRSGSPDWRGRAVIAGMLVTVWVGRAAVAAAGPSLSPLCAAFIQKAEQSMKDQTAKRQPMTPDRKRQLHQQVVARIERQLCDQPYFAAMNSQYVVESRKLTLQLARVYQALLNRLHGAAKAHLIRDEARWDGYHDGEDTNPENVINAYYDRVVRLRELLRELSVGPYPFVSDHVIIKDRYFKYGGVHTDAHYPQFDNEGPDAATTNRFFAESARKSVAHMEKLAAFTFSSPRPPGGPIPEYEYEQSFSLHRPGPYLIDVALGTYSFTGGAHGYGAGSTYLIDLRTGAIVPLEQMFAAGIPWRKRLTEIVRADFKRKYGITGSQYYGSLQIAETLRDSSNYTFLTGSLKISLNDTPPTVAFWVDVPYAQIESLLRADGLVTIARRPLAN